MSRIRAEVAAGDVAALAEGLDAFSLALDSAVGGAGNRILSPASIEIALTMLTAGARGETEAQLHRALHHRLQGEALFAAHNHLERELSSRGSGAKGKDDQPFRLRVANATWLQEGLEVEPGYLDVLARHFGAGLRLVEFAGDAEAARRSINEWVSRETEQKIPELMPDGSIDAMTRLVLTNAVYFNAAWARTFEPALTRDGDFTLADGSHVRVPFMHQAETHRYAEGDGWRAVELAYDGGEVAMLVVVGDASPSDVVRELRPRAVRLALPKFAFRSKFSLPVALRALGATDAFDPKRADLSGITGDRSLYVSDVIHEATIEVDERGTEAAAATGVAARLTSAPTDEVELVVDRPFLFTIRDVATGAIVFLGSVANPALSAG